MTMVRIRTTVAEVEEQVDRDLRHKMKINNRPHTVDQESLTIF